MPQELFMPFLVGLANELDFPVPILTLMALKVIGEIVEELEANATELEAEVAQ